MKNSSLVAIDIAKTIFQLIAVETTGKIVFSKKLTRTELLPFIAQLPSTLIAMEACGGAHYWARQFINLGHQVKLISAKYVKPFVRTNKNDFNDALAIAEAANRAATPVVSVKSIEQQDIQSIHRLRERAVMQRTALGNQIRGLLTERGVVMSKTFCALKREMQNILATQNSEVSDLFKKLLQDLYLEFLRYDEIVTSYEKQLRHLCKNNETCQRLLTIPGVGIMTASYILTVADPASFKNGRNFSAFLGLVPKQHSSGGKSRLLGISKRGDRYLRTLLIHGARAIVTKLSNKKDNYSLWLKKLLERRGYHKTYVALANKNARIIFALLKNNNEYNENLSMNVI